jgi:hypothetical protein
MLSKTILVALGVQMCLNVAHAQSDSREYSAYVSASQESTYKGTDFSKIVNEALDANFVDPWHLSLETDRRAERFMKQSGAGFPQPQGANPVAWSAKYAEAQNQAKSNILSEIASRGQAAAAERARFSGAAKQSYPSTRITMFGFVQSPDADQKYFSDDSSFRIGGSGPYQKLSSLLWTEQDLDNKTPDLKTVRSIMIYDGSRKDLAQFFDDMAYNNRVGKEIRATIGIDFDPRTSLGLTGFRASLSLLKFLAMNPDVIADLEKQHVHFRVYDAYKGKSYATLQEFYTTETWKSINLQMSSIFKEVAQPEFQEKVKLAKEMKEKIKQLPDTVEGAQRKREINYLIDEVRLKTGFVSTRNLVSDTILKLAATGETANFPLMKELASKVSAQNAAEVEFARNRESGKTVNPVEAARAAAREAK